MFVAGYVHREPAVRGAEGRLLGHPRHGRHSLHLLLHRQDPGGVSVRGGCGDWRAGAGARLLRRHRACLLRRAVGRSSGQLCADDRAAHDLHPIRRGLWRPNDRHFPQRLTRHPQLDDADWHLSDTAGLPQVVASRVHAQLLVHDVPHLHQHHHPRLLPARSTGVGMGQG